MPDENTHPTPHVEQENMENSKKLSIREKMISFFKLGKLKNSNGNKKNPENKKIRNIPKLVTKIVLFSAGAVAALILLILIFLDPILHFAITTIGSSIIDADISIGKIETSLTKGEVKIIDLKIANLEGFKAPEMLSLDLLYLSVDKDSLFSSEIIIRSLEVHKLHVTAETDSIGKLNLLVLADKFAGQEDEEEKKEEKKEPARINIEYFLLEDIRLNWIDNRTQNEIPGFGISLGKLSGSLSEGKAALSKFEITSPEIYDIDYAAKIDSISTEFVYNSFYTDNPTINNVTIDGLNVCAEYSRQGNFNFLEIIDSLIAVNDMHKGEQEEPPTQEDTPDDTQEDTQEENDLILRTLLLQNSFLILREDNTRVQLNIPLYLRKDEYDIDLGNSSSDILNSLRDLFVQFEELCNGATNAQELASKMFSDAMESAVKQGSDIIDNAAKSGKGFLEETVDLFTF